MATSFSGAEAPGFRHERESDGLLFRWATATASDIDALRFCGALAYGYEELEECLSDYALRQAEYRCRDSQLGGSPSHWAICVDRSADKSRIPQWRAPPDRGRAIESEYARGIRSRVAQASERIVAVVCVEREYAHFAGQSEGAPFGRISIVACLPAYRSRRGLLDGLFAMVHAKSKARGDAFCAVNGIPSYYRKHGYEYVMRVIHEMKTPLNLNLPLSDDSSGYSLRPCSAEDADTLVHLHQAQLPTSDFFISQEANHERLAFLAGVRKPPFDDVESLDLLMTNPVSILEYNGKGVAAVVFSAERGASANVGTMRLYVDPEHADLGRLSRELVSRVLAALNAFWDAQVPSEGYGDGADVLMPKPKDIIWRPAPGSPLVRHFLDNKLAHSVAQEDIIFNSARYQLFRLHSLSAALSAMRPVMTARLKAAKGILGSALTFDFGIAFYQGSMEGALIRIERSEAVEVESRSWKSIPFSRRDNVTLEKPVQLVAPVSAIMQLIFGYLSLDEAKKVYPDLQVAIGCRTLVEVLFPTMQYGGHLYT